MGEALISLSRQDIERADYYKGYDSRAANGVPVLGVTVLVTITKLGGGSWGWLSVYILFLMRSLSSIFRYCRVRRILQTDVQDPLRILEMTLKGGQEISLKSRIRIQDKLEVISSSIVCYQMILQERGARHCICNPVSIPDWDGQRIPYF
jgi:hypothetical protein